MPVPGMLARKSWRSAGKQDVESSALTSRNNGYLFALLALVIFSVQDAISKHLGSSYPPVFIATIRFWAFAVFATVIAVRKSGSLKLALRTKHPLLQILRGFMLALQVVMVITSFTYVGLARTQALLAATPLLVALLSAPLLGERVGWRRLISICVGFFGVLLLISPENGSFEMILLLPMACALLFGFYVIATRKVSRDDAALTSFFYTGIAGAAAISLVGPFYWTHMPLEDWIWTLSICVTGAVSHYLLIKAYDLLDAVAVQPLTYLQIVFAAAIGVTVFGEALSFNTILGSVIVTFAGIFTVWRETLAARRGKS